MTLFVEPEDLLYFSYVPDENTGYMTNSATRDPDEEMFLKEERMNVWYYERRHMKEFLQYIDQNFEPILFTQGTKKYTDFVAQKYDPEGKIFRHRLYRNSCYVIDKEDEDLKEFIKDIAQFDRDPR